MAKIIGPDGRDYNWSDIKSRPGPMAMYSTTGERSQVRSATGSEPSWVRVRVNKAKAAMAAIPKTVTVPFPTGTGKIFLLPLREPKVLTDAEKTTYPALPFLKEHELEKEIVEMLGKRSTVYSSTPYDIPPHFSLIPAIKQAKDVMGWDLRTAKDYVEKIYKENSRQINARRVECTQAWNLEYEKRHNERVQKLQKSVADARNKKS